MGRREQIKNAYKLTGGHASFYDGMMTYSTFLGKAICRMVWNMDREKNLDYLERALSGIPDGFSGKLLDVPVGTAVFTTQKYQRMTQADITCLDYSQDMLEQAEQRFREAGITHIKTVQGDVGALPYADETFDKVLCMNGLHVFPDKDKAYAEIRRTLKLGGGLLACFYIAGEQKVADWLAKTVMTRMGWFTPPFDTADDVRRRLEPYYDILDFHVEGAMLYFRARRKE